MRFAKGLSHSASVQNDSGCGMSISLHPSAEDLQSFPQPDDHGPLLLMWLDVYVFEDALV